MTDSNSKEKILTDAHYIFYYPRMFYFNKQTKKIFSIEAIRFNDESWLKKKMDESNTKGWKFYFTEPISKLIETEILSELRQ